MKTVVILQSSYIPWKGYFDLIARCDEFILFDDTQFTKRDWRSRNRIKTAQGLQWLTVPVESKGKFEQRIDEVRIADPEWSQQHWRTLAHAYGKAAHFGSQEGWVKGLYDRAATEPMLSRVNELFIRAICEAFSIKTPITHSADYPGPGKKTERLVDICRQAGATDYISGPAAKAYIEPALFTAAGLRLHYMNYAGYPEYPQLYGAFAHEVSVLDAIFNLGNDARQAIERAQFKLDSV